MFLILESQSDISLIRKLNHKGTKIVDITPILSDYVNINTSNMKVGIAEMPISISDSNPFQHSIIKNANSNARYAAAAAAAADNSSSAMETANGGDESDLS